METQTESTVAEPVKSVHPGAFFHYECDGIRDTGWGCCYRSFQNACLLHDVTVNMKDIVENEGAWVEPAQLLKFLPKDLRCSSFLWYKTPSAIRRLLSTEPEDYEKILSTQELLPTLYRLAKNSSLLVDNGISAYCLYYSNGWVLVDPHTSNPAKFKVSQPLGSIGEFLKDQQLLMIVAINR